jgi:hypothetical protein
MSKGAWLLLALVGGLAVAAGVALAAAAAPTAGGPRAREFHGLVGGLGLGPALEPGECEQAFDPRLSPDCSCDGGPVPGGVFFCPHHACSVLPYPPGRPARERGRGGADALP